jgi:hypothetical protein
MPVDPAHLMDEVYNLLTNTYAASAGKQALLAFESFGIPISDTMFKVNPSDTTLSPALAVERLSDIVNKSLQVQGTSVAWGMNTVDSAVKLCLESSMPVNADAAPAVGAARQDAKPSFDATLGSMSGLPDDRFRPVNAIPVNWYDSAVNSNWVTHTVGQPQPPSPTHPPVPIAPPVWHVLPETYRAQISTAPAPGHPLLMMNAPAHTVSPVLRQAAVLSLAPKTGIAARSASLETPANAAKSVLVTAKPQNIILTSAIVALNANTTSQPVTTNSIGMTFDHCVVSLTRKWFPDTFLLMRDWYVPGYARGDISNGSGAGDPGIAPILTTGFVAVRNLKITSNWSQADLAAIQGSAAFGPFSLLGRSYNATTGTLSCPGLQIIGWFCSPMPVLPPVSDPNLPAQKT